MTGRGTKMAEKVCCDTLEVHEDLLKIVNETLKKSNQKEISLSSLKRYIGVSKSMTSDDRERLYTSYYENFKERKDEMSSATNNMKNIKKKKFDYISINIIDDIMKNILNL